MEDLKTTEETYQKLKEKHQSEGKVLEFDPDKKKTDSEADADAAKTNSIEKKIEILTKKYPKKEGQKEAAAIIKEEFAETAIAYLDEDLIDAIIKRFKGTILRENGLVWVKDESSGKMVKLNRAKTEDFFGRVLADHFEKFKEYNPKLVENLRRELDELVHEHTAEKTDQEKQADKEFAEELNTFFGIESKQRKDIVKWGHAASNVINMKTDKKVDAYKLSLLNLAAKLYHRISGKPLDTDLDVSGKVSEKQRNFIQRIMDNEDGSVRGIHKDLLSVISEIKKHFTKEEIKELTGSDKDLNTADPDLKNITLEDIVKIPLILLSSLILKQWNPWTELSMTNG